MRLTTFSDSVLLVEQHRIESRKILKESCEGLTKQQRLVVENVYKHFSPLIEATLTADQISQVFGAVEKSAAEGGQNKTALGKAAGAAGAAVKGSAEAAKKANEILNQAGKWLQDTKPVQNFDAKFEELKDKINKKFPDSKILDGISKMGIWAQENPGKTAAIIGVLTAIAALAGGPVGGAIAGQILRGSTELLKGEKLSTAVGKGLKTAAIGWLAGMTVDKIGDMISNVYGQMNPIPISGSSTFKAMNFGNGLPSTFQDAAIYGSEKQLGQFRELWSEAVKEWRSGNFDAAEQAFQKAKEFAEKVSTETMNKIAIEGDPADKIRSLNQALDGFATAAQGAATGATAYDKQGNPVEAGNKQESIYQQQRPLSEGQVYLLFNRVERLNEGPLWDKLKDQGKKAADAAKAKAAEVGSNLANKVTASKLNAAWKKAGSPTDSNELADFLKQQGIGDDVIRQVYQGMNIEIPADQQEPEQDQEQDQAQDQQSQQQPAQAQPQQQTDDVPSVKLVIEKIKKLAPEDREELLQDLKQEMGTV